MTTALGLAAVTQVLKDLLNNGLIDHDADATVGEVRVTALAPDRIPVATGSEQSQLNLYLYRVAANPGWRNEVLPARDSEGRLRSNPPLALDLHYLLTAYGQDELHAEILLGYGMQLLHETPVLGRAEVRRALAPPFPLSGGGVLPTALQALTTSQLAEQAELVTISPEALSTEEVSNLWSTFEAPYRPSAAYLASVVLIERHRSTRPPLPVRKRNIYVVPFRHPLISRVVAEAGEDLPILAGTVIALEGRQLRGPITQVNVAGIIVDPHQVTDTEIRLRLPDGLRAGVQGVQVAQPELMGTPPVPHRGVESDSAAFVLRPSINAVGVSNISTVTVGGVTTRSADVAVQCVPNVGRSQRVVLLLNESQSTRLPSARSYSFVLPAQGATDPEEASSVAVRVQGVAPGDYLVRLQVDGAESPLQADADGRYVAPQVTI